MQKSMCPLPLVERPPARREPLRACGACGEGHELGFDFTFAFQPIADVADESVHSYEALVRGPRGESAFHILSLVDDANRYRFDQACRVKALTLASHLGLQTRININFMPNAVYKPELCIRTTVEAARALQMPLDRIVFEVMEGEQILDHAHLKHILSEYNRFGLQTAIDDFGAGFSGLNLLADYQPNYIKLDMHLVRDIDRNTPRQAIVRGVLAFCRDLGIRAIAEGVETFDEYVWLRRAGVEMFQGYLFAKPAFEALPSVDFRSFRIDCHSAA